MHFPSRRRGIRHAYYPSPGLRKAYGGTFHAYRDFTHRRRFPIAFQRGYGLGDWFRHAGPKIWRVVKKAGKEAWENPMVREMAKEAFKAGKDAIVDTGMKMAVDASQGQFKERAKGRLKEGGKRLLKDVAMVPVKRVGKKVRDVFGGIQLGRGQHHRGSVGIKKRQARPARGKVSLQKSRGSKTARGREKKPQKATSKTTTAIARGCKRRGREDSVDEVPVRKKCKNRLYSDSDSSHLDIF